MIRIFYYTPEGEYRTDLQPEALPALLQKEDGFVWVDLDAEPADRSAEVLSGIFHFHPLAIDDTLNEINVPKLDDWGEYLYLVLQSVVYEDHGEDPLAMLELDAFLGHNYLVTYHEAPSTAVTRVWEMVKRDERLPRSGPDHLLYRLADELINEYIALLETLEERLDIVEDQVFTRPSPNTLTNIFILKRRLLQVRRLVVPQREVFNKLARDPFAVIDDEDRVFFRDLYDHMLRLYDLMESLRDMVAGTLEIYLSVVNNRMNDIMKTLTIITTFFMPLTFITGFFGMNFFEPSFPLPEWTSQLAFMLTLLAMILFPISMIWWMRRRAWM